MLLNLIVFKFVPGILKCLDACWMSFFIIIFNCKLIFIKKGLHRYKINVNIFDREQYVFLHRTIVPSVHISVSFLFPSLQLNSVNELRRECWNIWCKHWRRTLGNLSDHVIERILKTRSTCLWMICSISLSICLIRYTSNSSLHSPGCIAPGFKKYWIINMEIYI